MIPHQQPPSTLLPAQKFDEPWPRYMHPYACFECRKSFKRLNVSEPVLPCPHCRGPSVGLTRSFKPPKQSDIKQWRKVEALVRHGFLFWNLGTKLTASPRGTQTNSDNNGIAFQTPSKRLMRQWQVSTEWGDRSGP